MIVIFFDFLCLGVLACSGDCFGNVCFSGLATLLWLSVVLIMRQSRWCCRGKFILDVSIGVPADAVVSPNMKAADTLNCWWLDWTGSGQGIWWLAQLELDCPLCLLKVGLFTCSVAYLGSIQFVLDGCTQYLVGLYLESQTIHLGVCWSGHGCSRAQSMHLMSQWQSQDN